MSTTTFGKYKLIAELGHGGMADVFLAVQAGPAGSGFSKLTVLKRLRQNLAEEPEFVAMLVDEARIAARLNHPNVVQTNEVGEVDNKYFISMEYLDGQPLHRIQHRAAQRLKDGLDPLLMPEQQYLIVMDTLAGLHHAHELADYDGTALEIVHRDITPHNIFVTYTGQTKVVDFGIAKAVGRASETRQGVVKGKVRYMAPEQAIGRRVDRRSDVFAAGVILWEAATGKRLWAKMEELQIVQALLSGDIPSSPKSKEPSVPDGIDAICRKALAAAPEDRYATAEDFRAELEQYLVESGKLLTTRRNLPGIVAELFKDKRAEIKSVIEKQFALLEQTGDDSNPSERVPAIALDASMPSALHTRGADLLAAGRASSPSLASGTLSGTEQRTAVMSAGTAPVGATPRKNVAVVALGAFGVLLLAAGGVIALRSPPSKAVAATTTSAGGSASAAPAEIMTLRLSATPASALVSIDNGPPEPVPLEKALARDDKDHLIRFVAAGYESKVFERIRFRSDFSLVADLQRDPNYRNAGQQGSQTPPQQAAPFGTGVRPSTGGLGPARPDTAKPDTAKPDTAKPDTAKPDTAKPDVPPTSPTASGRKGLSIDNKDPWAEK